jgi:hypothetical protein
MRLPRAEGRKLHDIKQLFITYLSLYEDVVVAHENVAVETFPSWEFYRVSVFRWNKAGAGCGTKEFRDQLWQRTVDGVNNRFDQSTTPQGTWKWVWGPFESKMELETLDHGTGQIQVYQPGLVFSILKEAQ